MEVKGITGRNGEPGETCKKYNRAGEIMLSHCNTH